MIIVEDVCQVYNHKQVLFDLCLSLERGTCVGLMGKSGSGKSTLGRIIAGIEKPRKGRIYVRETEVQVLRSGEVEAEAKSGEVEAEAKSGAATGGTRQDLCCQVVFQNAAASVNPNFTVHQVLGEAMRFAKKQAAKGRVTKASEAAAKGAEEQFYGEALARVGLGHISGAQPARSLSGGQLQRLCLARALMLEPDLIILDEAISGLDPLVQRDMLRLLAQIRKEQQMTMLFIAHDLGATYYLCDSVFLLKKGQLVWQANDLDTLSYEDVEEAIEQYS